jgi:hypothetical protein
MHHPASVVAAVALAFGSSVAEPTGAATTDDATTDDEAVESPEFDAEALVRSLVSCRAPYQSGVGVLADDAHTVIFPAGALDTGRPVSCRPLGREEGEVEGEASVWVVAGPPVWVIELESDVPAGRALPVSSAEVLPGDTVWVPQPSYREDGSVELDVVETTIDAVATQRLSLAGAGWLEPGSPVLDADGGLLGVLIDRTTAARCREILRPADRAPRGMGNTPIFGMRLGGELGGFTDGAFAFDLEAGVALWDQLSLTLRLGFTVGDERQIGLSPLEGLGPGFVSGIPAAFTTGLAVRYRWMLGTAEAMPFYLAVAVEGHYAASGTAVSGSAFYGETGCDPRIDPCRVTWREAPDLPFEHGVGPAFGVDLVLGGLTIGYRYLPAAVSYGFDVDLHRITVGMGML